MRHVLSALVHNQPGVLAHVSGMLASRGFNIDSLAVGETERAELSRMTFVVRGDDAELEQVRKQLDKVVTVVKVLDISSEDFVERDLMLIKVRATPPQRTEIALLVEMKPGERIRITQTVRVGARQWTATVAGTYRGLNYLETGLMTDRVQEDDIVVPVVHFVKDNGELSSVTLDENSQLARE